MEKPDMMEASSSNSTAWRQKKLDQQVKHHTHCKFSFLNMCICSANWWSKDKKQNVSSQL
jgi:hypothetical protein